VGDGLAVLGFEGESLKVMIDRVEIGLGMLYREFRRIKDKREDDWGR
jgi:hypothetical protein